MSEIVFSACSFNLFENSGIFSILIEKPAAPLCPPYFKRRSEKLLIASIILNPSILLQEAVAIPSSFFISIIIVGL